MPTEEEEAGAALVLDQLRQLTGDAGLRYALFPEAVTGGASGAVIYAFELASPPAQLAGPLIFRMPASDELSRRKEAALQDAAGRLGCRVPRIRHTGSLDPGGIFFVMDRLAGGTLYRWLGASLGISIVAAIGLGQPWLPVLGFLVGSALVGVGMGVHFHQLHQLRLEDVKRVYEEHGLQDADVDVAKWLVVVAESIDGGNIEGYVAGLQWLRDNTVERVRPGLCHGDLHPGNCMATWTRMTGVIDWENAIIAEPELDIAGMRWVATLVGPVLLPIHWFYLSYARTRTRLDPQRLCYYEALRTLYQLSMWTRGWLEMEDLKSRGEEPPAAPPPWVVRRLINSQVRRFRTLTGVQLTAPAVLLRK